MYRILIVEDEKIMHNELATMLKNNGYETCCIEEFENVAEQVSKENADLILLDINLPCENGYQICSKIRADMSVPIIFLTSRNSDMDELNSFISGGDDYITKPYNVPVLLARISNLLKRIYKDSENEIVEYKDLTLFVEKNLASHDQSEIELTKNEFKILHYLLINRGQIVSRVDILDYLWDSALFVNDNTLTVNITRIRNKMEELGIKDYIKTKRGQGYMI